MNISQVVAISALSVLISPIIVYLYVDWRKRSIYRAQIRHYIDLISVDAGNKNAGRLLREILRMSHRHSVPIESLGWCYDDLRKETVKSLRRSAARARLFAIKERNPDINARHKELVSSLREQIHRLQAQAA